MSYQIDASDTQPERRQTLRRQVDAPYTWLRLRRAGKRRFSLTVHVYDISTHGMRFELDEPLPTGEEVEVELTLPGAARQALRARGRVIRFHDLDEVGPMRMALVFTEMPTAADRQALDAYLDAA